MPSPFALKPNSGGEDFGPRVLAPAGTHAARLVAIIGLGTQKNEFQGETKWQPKVRLSFEIPEERIEHKGEDKPMMLSKEFTLSLHEKSKLRSFLVGMTGKQIDENTGIDLQDLLGSACLLSVAHGVSKAGKPFASITGASPLLKGMQVRPQENPSTVYSVDQGENEIFKALHGWLQDTIKASKEWGTGDDELP